MYLVKNRLTNVFGVVLNPKNYHEIILRNVNGKKFRSAAMVSGERINDDWFRLSKEGLEEVLSLLNLK